MAKQLINEVKRFQKIAGIITEDESRTKMGLYLMFSAKDGKLVATMDLPNHSENDSVKKQIEAKGEYKLHYTDDPSNYLKFSKDGYKKYVGKTAEELGIIKESLNESPIDNLITTYLTKVGLTLTPEERAKFANAIEMDYEESDISRATMEDLNDIFGASGIRAIEDDEPGRG